jgi:hypothetical protein
MPRIGTADSSLASARVPSHDRRSVGRPVGRVRVMVPLKAWLRRCRGATSVDRAGEGAGATQMQRCREALLRLSVARVAVPRSVASLQRCTCSGAAKRCFASALHVQRCREALLRPSVARVAVPRSSASPQRCTCCGAAKRCFAPALHVLRWREAVLRRSVARVAVRRNAASQRRCNFLLDSLSGEAYFFSTRSRS